MFVLFAERFFTVAEGYKITDLTSKKGCNAYILALNRVCAVQPADWFCTGRICLQDAFDLKPPKKSPIALRTVVFAMTMLCGISICSMCMKQLGSDGWSRVVKIEVVEQPCNKSIAPLSEAQFVRYPQPITYSRWDLRCGKIEQSRLFNA